MWPGKHALHVSGWKLEMLRGVMAKSDQLCLMGGTQVRTHRCKSAKTPTHMTGPQQLPTRIRRAAAASQATAPEAQLGVDGKAAVGCEHEDAGRLVGVLGREDDLACTTSRTAQTWA